MAYATNTSVPVAKSKADIEQLVGRYGAEQFFSGWNGAKVTMGFVFGGRAIRFDLEMPSRQDREFTLTETGRERSARQAESAWEQACRSRWRALLLVIKAKLEAVESGISTLEQEFMAWTVAPGRRDGKTLGQVLLPEVAAALDSGQTAKLTWS